MDHLCYLCLVFVIRSRASVHCCLVITLRERAHILAFVCDGNCDFVTFQFGILAQVWYLIVLIHDPCCLSYFNTIDNRISFYNNNLGRLPPKPKITFRNLMKWVQEVSLNNCK